MTDKLKPMSAADKKTIKKMIAQITKLDNLINSLSPDAIINIAKVETGIKKTGLPALVGMYPGLLEYLLTQTETPKR